jgi:hypothetical protein
MDRRHTTSPSSPVHLQYQAPTAGIFLELACPQVARAILKCAATVLEGLQPLLLAMSAVARWWFCVPPYRGFWMLGSTPPSQDVAAGSFVFYTCSACRPGDHSSEMLNVLEAKSISA